MRKAIFAGSFDPYTLGHHDIVVRAMDMFDQIVIGIGKNSTKKEMFPLQERIRRIEEIYKGNEKVKVVAYEGLTVDFAKAESAKYLLRGVRSVTDFAYEQQIAEANKQLGGIETVLLFTSPEYAHISSTLVRDVYSYGKDISIYLP